MKKLTNIKRKIIRYFCTGICLSAVAFVFQACYGHPHDDYLDADVVIKGRVTGDSADTPLPNVAVSIKGRRLADTTDANGLFSIYVLRQDMYNMRFESIEADSIGSFLPKDTIIYDDNVRNEIFLNIRLDAR